MKSKYVTKSKAIFNKWITISNLLAKSLCPQNIVLRQFNNLTPLQRKEIKKLFDDCDITRRKKIPEGESDAWLLGIMVDAHIIATQYEIDSLTAVLCINPICKANEKIIVR